MKPYQDWGLPRKIFTNILFWLPVQYAVIMLIGNLGLLPSNLSADKMSFCGPTGAFIHLGYYVRCCEVGLIYTIVGSILISRVGLGSKKFWIWFSILYSIYLITTFIGMYKAEGAWFFDGFGCYILDVWLAPLLWLWELFLAKYIYNRVLPRGQELP